MTRSFTRPSPPLLAFLLGSLVFGLSQALNALYLNFYLEALGLRAASIGLLNALPALALVLAGASVVRFSRRYGNARTLQLGALTGLLGTLLLGLAHGTPLALLGMLVQGLGGAGLVVAGAPYIAEHTGSEQRVGVFSLQLALMTGAGFVGNLLGGQVPEWWAAQAGVAANSAEALRAAFWLSAGLQLLGLLPLLRLKNGVQAVAEPGQSRLDAFDRRVLPRLILPNALVGLGAGAVIPFLNLFIQGKFGVSYASLGHLFAWTSLATAATVLLQPLLVRRLGGGPRGHLRAVLIVQGASLPFLALMGFAPLLSLVSLSLFTRGALMNAAGPAYSAYAMDLLSPTARPVYSALNPVFWNVGWALSSTLSGLVRAWLPGSTGFTVCFAWIILMYGGSLGSIWLGLARPDWQTLKVSLRGGTQRGAQLLERQPE